MTPITPADIEIARRLPSTEQVLDFFRGWELKGARIVNKTGSSVSLRVGKGKLRKELRFRVEYMLRSDEADWLGPRWEFGRTVADAFGTDCMSALMTEYQFHGLKMPPYRANGDAVIGSLLLEELPNVKVWYDKLVELARGGESEKKKRAHNREMSMKDARNALEMAFANGATREEAISMIDMLLVKGIMDR